MYQPLRRLGGWTSYSVLFTENNGQNNYAKIINNIVHPSNEDCFIFFQMKHKESSTVREAPPSSTGGLGGVFGPSKPLAKKEGGLVSQIASKFQNNSSESSPPPANSKFNENRYRKKDTSISNIEMGLPTTTMDICLRTVT